MKTLLLLLVATVLLCFVNCSVSGHKSQSWHPHQYKKPMSKHK